MPTSPDKTLRVPYEDLGRVNAPLFEALTAAFTRVAKRGWYILGAEVAAFETEFAAFVGSRHCVGVASGLDALVLAFDALRITPGSEVLVASNTYIATILAILRAGLKPVLVEPDPESCNIDPSAIVRAITSETRALCVTHLYGRPCDMLQISRLAADHGLVIVEDCAQAHGARVAGRHVGTFGIGAFSFYPTKNLGALGDGGAVVCDDEEIADRIRTLRNYGSKRKYYNDLIGYNSRLDELQAALLRVKLPHLDDLNAHKTRLASLYRAHLPASVHVLPARPGLTEVHHIFPIFTPHRDALRAHLLSEGIGAEVHYPVPPHRQVAMRDVFSGDYPIADRIHQEILSLPCSVIHTPEEVLSVCEAITAFEGDVSSAASTRPRPGDRW